MSASVANVFDSFSEYKIKILFQPWSTNNVLHFALSCIGLMVFSGLYHIIRYGRMSLEHNLYVAYMKSPELYERHTSDSEERAGLTSTEYHLAPLPKPSKASKDICLVYFSLSLVTFIQYAYGMLLFLSVMTFNPWVFIAVITGYTAGDIATQPAVMKIKCKQYTLR